MVVVAVVVTMPVAMIVTAPVAAIVTCRCVFVVFNSGSLRSPIRSRIGMHVAAAIGPRPPPGTAIDQDIMLAPSEANSAPSKRSE